MDTDPLPSSGNLLERVRRGNLATVLRLVHDRGPLSRAVLTRETGLNRSTVGALVAELEGLGLVREGPARAGAGAGRPSPEVRADPSVVAIAVNPEVDALSLAVVGLDGSEHVRVRRSLPSVPSPEEAASVTAEVVDELGGLLAGLRVVGVGVAVPGVVRVRDGVVRVAPHLRWRDEPFAERLGQHLGQRLPVSAANDATLGVRAERMAGSARGFDDVVYLNGGASGIGGALVLGGQVVGGRDGYAGEIGHTMVRSRGKRCHCGALGCLETVVSQAALLEAAGPTARAGTAAPGPGGSPLPPDELLREALLAPTPALAAEVEQQLAHLAVALRGVILTVNPALVVLGGFLAILHDHAPDRLRTLVLEQTMPALGDGVAFASTTLGSSILLRGAAALAFEPLLRDPAGHPLGQ